jgi:hypothetical protein
VLLEYAPTEYQTRATPDDGNSPYLVVGKDGKQVMVMHRLKIKGHAFIKGQEVKTGFTTLDSDGPFYLAFGFSADGRRLLLADKDRQLLLLGIQLRIQPAEAVVEAEPMQLSFNNPESKIQPLLLLPDGKQALMADEDQSVGIWNLEAGKEVRPLDGLRLPVNALAVSATGQQVLAWTGSRNVALWDTATGQESRRLEIPQRKVRLVVMSGDGRRALIDTEDNMLQVWDLETGKAVQRLQCPDNPPTAIALSADGRRAAAAVGKVIQVWDLGS